MKTTFDNRELCHIWAQQTQNNGKGSHMFFEGTSIYSYGYHFKIAEFITAPNGQQVVLFNAEGYSSTTAKHKSYVRSAINHKTIFECRESSFRSWNLAGEITRRIELVTESITKAGKAKKNVEYYLQNAASQIEELKTFANTFNLPLPEVVAELGLQTVLSDDNIKLLRDKEAKAAARARAKAADDIQKWLTGEKESINYKQEVFLRQSGDDIETSYGATVSLKEGKMLYKELAHKRPVEGIKIGYYTVDNFDGNILKIGCHKLKMSEINRFANEMQWS